MEMELHFIYFRKTQTIQIGVNHFRFNISVMFSPVLHINTTI